MARYMTPELTPPPSRQRIFRFNDMPGSIMVREACDEEDEEKKPLFECRICSIVIPSDDSAVYHNDSDACIDEGNYFCAPCFQERLESQLLPTCAGCGGQLLYPNDLRCRSGWAEPVDRDRMVAALRDYCTRTPLPAHFHIALSPSEMATALSVNTDEEAVRGLYDEVDNWFWLQEDLGSGADLGDTWTPTEIIEQQAVTLDELSFYHLWRLHILLGAKAFRAIKLDEHPNHAFLLPKMPEFDLDATLDEVEYVADEDALPDRPLDPPPVLPMIPLSSKDLVMLTNPEPFHPGQVDLDLDTLNEAAARLGNNRWYLFRPKEAPARFNTTFVLPWPGTHLPGQYVHTSAES